jgi:manganese transport protein
MHGSVEVPPIKPGFWQQWRAYVGPAILISVGYMDPGNWGTDLAAAPNSNTDCSGWSAGQLDGHFHASHLLAFGRRDRQRPGPMLPRLVSALDALAKLAVLRIGHRRVRSGGSARQRRRPQYHVPHSPAVGRHHHRVGCAAAPGLQRFGMRTIEAIVLLLVATIGLATSSRFLFCRKCGPISWKWGALVYSEPSPGGDDLRGHRHHRGDGHAAQLYLHSALVQSRKLQKDEASIRSAIRFNAIDSIAALTVAFFVNAAIMVLAAMVFYGKTSVTVAGGKSSRSALTAIGFASPT